MASACFGTQAGFERAKSAFRAKGRTSVRDSARNVPNYDALEQAGVVVDAVVPFVSDPDRYCSDA